MSGSREPDRWRTCPEMVWEGLDEGGPAGVAVDRIVRGSGVMVDGRPGVSRGTALRYLKLWRLAGYVRLEGRGAAAKAWKLVAGRVPRVTSDGPLHYIDDPVHEAVHCRVYLPGRGSAPEAAHYKTFGGRYSVRLPGRPRP